LAACQRKRLRLARFPSKRNARNASDCVWMETGFYTSAAAGCSFYDGEFVGPAVSRLSQMPV